MPPTLTPADLARLEALAAAATPGPWRMLDVKTPWVYAADCVVHRMLEAFDPAMRDPVPRWLADAAFIAAAREAVPSLLATLRQATARLDEVAAEATRLELALEAAKQSRCAQDGALTALDAALGHGADEDLWPPGLTRGEAVARLVRERDAARAALRDAAEVLAPTGLRATPALAAVERRALAARLRAAAGDAPTPEPTPPRGWETWWELEGGDPDAGIEPDVVALWAYRTETECRFVGLSRDDPPGIWWWAVHGGPGPRCGQWRAQGTALSAEAAMRAADEAARKHAGDGPEGGSRG